MKAELPVRYNFLRITVSLILIAFMGCKIVLPLFSPDKISIKEISANTENDGNDGEKKTGDDLQEKEKTFLSFPEKNEVFVMWHVNIIHLTAYTNNYLSSHFQTIVIPPPDRV